MFMTPRGLKIRIDVQTGFALMARLWQKDNETDAFRVLKTCEGLEHIPSIFAFVAGLAGLFLGSEWWHVAAGIVGGSILGKLLTMFGAFVLPGLPTFATLWSWASGYGVFLLASVICSFLV